MIVWKGKYPKLKLTELKRVTRFLFVALILSFISVNPGCKKDKACSPKPPASEIPQIEAFATANGITATAHQSGLYYQVIDMGSGPKATSASRISITYTGKLMNGKIFDEQLTPNGALWALNGLIEGWIVGIPLINEGGHIKLIIPSSMAYGCEQYYEIPGNSVLYFDIHLVDVQ
jgi:FKBP-type peptidyl-prolyl cis-trans isomerase FkpA